MLSEHITARAYATEAGTTRFVQRHGAATASDAYSRIGKIALSSIGLGSYLGPSDDASDADYTAAVTDAVRRGINVFDTASNYRCQRSERAIGLALQGLIDRGEIYRSEVLVASKAGFVAFDRERPADPAGYMHDRTVGLGLCAPDELQAGCHCLAPDYLAATLAQSRANLGLETIDVYFLHNPETQLQHIDQATLLERLRRAFVAMEAAADKGWIRVYGLATWSGLRARPQERDFLPLELAVQAAYDVAGARHRFKAVQMPLSLSMPEAHLHSNQRHGTATLAAIAAAQRLGLAVFASAALHQGRLARHRLTHVPPLPFGHHGVDACEPGMAALQFARSVPGVVTALVGMRQMAHVAHNAQVLRLPRAPLSWVDAAARPAAPAWTGV